MIGFLSALSPCAWFRIGMALLVAAAVSWVVLELRAGARLAVQVEQLKTQVKGYEDAAADRALVAKAEAARLAAEQQDRLTYGRLLDEAASDPGAAAPSLGVRSVDRLNAIR